MDPPVHVFRNIWTPGPYISKYLDPHGTNIENEPKPRVLNVQINSQKA